MTYSTLTLEIRDGVGLLTLDRPAVLNALNKAMIDELKSALDTLRDSPDARSVLLTGSGKGFCAGADLAVFRSGADDLQGHDTLGDLIAAAMYDGFNRVVQKLWEMPKPVVIAVNGVAAGGGLGVSLTGDVVLAARSARFVSVFGPQLGIAPDMGTTYHLQRLVGRSRALSMAMLGEAVDAEQALDWGLIYKVVEDDQLQATAMAIALKLAQGPILAFPRIREGFAHAETATMSEQLAWEAETQRVLCSTDDFMEGVNAFVGKRKPQFRGR